MGMKRTSAWHVLVMAKEPVLGLSARLAAAWRNTMADARRVAAAVPARRFTRRLEMLAPKVAIGR
jgi:hypothetical protein